MAKLQRKTLDRLVSPVPSSSTRVLTWLDDTHPTPGGDHAPWSMAADDPTTAAAAAAAAAASALAVAAGVGVVQAGVEQAHLASINHAPGVRTRPPPGHTDWQLCPQGSGGTTSSSRGSPATPATPAQPRGRGVAAASSSPLPPPPGVVQVTPGGAAVAGSGQEGISFKQLTLSSPVKQQQQAPQQQATSTTQQHQKHQQQQEPRHHQQQLLVDCSALQQGWPGHALASPGAAPVAVQVSPLVSPDRVCSGAPLVTTWTDLQAVLDTSADDLGLGQATGGSQPIGGRVAAAATAAAGGQSTPVSPPPPAVTGASSSGGSFSRLRSWRWSPSPKASPAAAAVPMPAATSASAAAAAAAAAGPGLDGSPVLIEERVSTPPEGVVPGRPRRRGPRAAMQQLLATWRSKAQHAPGAGSSSSSSATTRHTAPAAGQVTASPARPAKRQQPAAKPVSATAAAAPAVQAATTSTAAEAQQAATASAGVAAGTGTVAASGPYPSPRPSWQSLLQRLSSTTRSSDSASHHPTHPAVTRGTLARHQGDSVGAASGLLPHEAGLSPQGEVPQYAGAHFGPAQAARLSYVFNTSTLYSPAAPPLGSSTAAVRDQPPAGGTEPGTAPGVKQGAGVDTTTPVAPRLVTILSDTGTTTTTTTSNSSSSSSGSSTGGSSQHGSSNHSHKGSRGCDGHDVATCDHSLAMHCQQQPSALEVWPHDVQQEQQAQEAQQQQWAAPSGGHVNLTGIQSMVSPRRLQHQQQQQRPVQGGVVPISGSGAGSQRAPLPLAPAYSDTMPPGTGFSSCPAGSGVDPVNAEYAHWCDVVDRVVDRLQAEALTVQEEVEGLTGVQEWLGRMVAAMPLPPTPPQGGPASTIPATTPASSGGSSSGVARSGAAEALGDVRQQLQAKHARLVNTSQTLSNRALTLGGCLARLQGATISLRRQGSTLALPDKVAVLQLVLGDVAEALGVVPLAAGAAVSPAVSPGDGPPAVCSLEGDLGVLLAGLPPLGEAGRRLVDLAGSNPPHPHQHQQQQQQQRQQQATGMPAAGGRHLVDLGAGRGPQLGTAAPRDCRDTPVSAVAAAADRDGGQGHLALANRLLGSSGRAAVGPGAAAVEVAVPGGLPPAAAPPSVTAEGGGSAPGVTAGAAQVLQDRPHPQHPSVHHPPHAQQLQTSAGVVGPAAKHEEYDEDDEEYEEEDSCGDASDPLLDTLSDIFSAYRTPRTSFGGNSIASSSGRGHAAAAAAAAAVAAAGATGYLATGAGGNLYGAAGSNSNFGQTGVEVQVPGVFGSGLTRSSEFEGFEEDMRRGPSSAAVVAAAGLLAGPAARGTPAAAEAAPAAVMAPVAVVGHHGADGWATGRQGGSHTSSGTGSSNSNTAGGVINAVGAGRVRPRPAGMQLIVEEEAEVEVEEEEQTLPPPAAAAGSSKPPGDCDLACSDSGGSSGTLAHTSTTSSSGGMASSAAAAAGASAGASRACTKSPGCSRPSRGVLASPVSQLLAQPGWERLTVGQLLTQLTAALAQQPPQQHQQP